MRHEYHRPCVVLQGDCKRLAHLEIEMVGRLVQQQQVGPEIRHQSQHQPSLLAAGKRRDRLEHSIATEAKSCEKVAQLLLCCPRCRFGAHTSQVLEGRVAWRQLFELVLREISSAQVTGLSAFTA